MSAQSIQMVEIWRGAFPESAHLGAAVVSRPNGEIVHAWGDPERVILPRSSCKMLQALPLIESGAADRFGLTSEHLALACASHQGGSIHTDRVSRWLAVLELDESDLRCGPQRSSDHKTQTEMIKRDEQPSQLHNNCSGKHTGFLTLSKHLGGGPEYNDPDHVIQRMIRAAFEDMTGSPSPGHAIDGCSAPNFACSLSGLARSMARMTTWSDGSARSSAAERLTRAMTSHPELVAGEGRACTRLMRAMEGRVAVKTGAEAVFTAIIPELQLGVAVKIDDGATRASEAAIAHILVGLGVLDPQHPEAKQLTQGPILNRRQIATGQTRISDAFTLP